MGNIPLKNSKGERIGDFQMDESLMVRSKGLQAVHEAVVAYTAHQRAGTASTLTKGTVAGSNKKPWKQKGLGRARAGYRQSPVWRGGGVSHGPLPRKYGKKISKKVVKLAFQRALTAKVEQGQVQVIEDLSVAAPKTKEFAALMKRLELSRGALFIVDAVSSDIVLASRNIPRVEVVSAQLANTYQLLRYPSVVVTKAGMEALEKRLS